MVGFRVPIGTRMSTILKIKKAPCEGARSCLLNSSIDRYPTGRVFCELLGTFEDCLSQFNWVVHRPKKADFMGFFKKSFSISYVMCYNEVLYGPDKVVEIFYQYFVTL